MAVSSKTFEGVASHAWFRAWEVPRAYHRYFTWFQLIVTYVFMEITLWSSRLALQNRWFFVSAVTLVAFVLIDRPSLQRLGLGLPSGLGASLVLAISFATAVFLVFAVRGLGGEIPANPTWPNLHLAWQYFVWALVQEFMLQSFFFTRCEELFGSSAAVWVAATLFAAVHLPSPILTTFTLIGGLFFCEMFRRYRSIYPIGIVHAVLGLTIATTMPDSVLHHMRVGIGYLRY
jgi:membrane protease YdiL (CAAX protease family)